MHWSLADFTTAAGIGLPPALGVLPRPAHNWVYMVARWRSLPCLVVRFFLCTPDPRCSFLISHDFQLFSRLYPSSSIFSDSAWVTEQIPDPRVSWFLMVFPHLLGLTYFPQHLVCCLVLSAFPVAVRWRPRPCLCVQYGPAVVPLSSRISSRRSLVAPFFRLRLV